MLRQVTQNDIQRTKGDVKVIGVGAWLMQCPPNQIGQAAGCRLYVQPTVAPPQRLMKYTLTIDPHFDAVKGGKLPGIHGADWSARVMFRRDRAAELYVHTVTDPRKTLGPDAQYIGIVDGEHVVSLWRGKWTFPLGRSVDVYLTCGGGKLGLAIDGVGFRTAYPAITTPATGLLLVFFYGGGDLSWAPAKEETIEVRDVFIG